MRYAIDEIVCRVVRHPILAAKYLLGKDPSEIPLRLIARNLTTSSPIIVEAGAFDGKDTGRFLSKWPTCTVFAFEPIPHLCKRLVDRFACDSRVSVVDRALVGDLRTRVLMYTFKPENIQNGSSSLLRPNSHTSRAPEIDLSDQVEVPAITLETWGNDSGLVWCDLLWLDLQGSELEVLQGSLGFLSRTRVVHIEVADEPMYDGAATSNQIGSFLRNNGFIRIARRQLGIYGNELYLNSRFEI